MKTNSDNVQDIRREQLRRWINERCNGVQARFIKDTKSNQGEISAILKGVKSFGEVKARNLEKKAGMPPYWLDKIDDSNLTASGVNIPILDLKAEFQEKENEMIGGLLLSPDWMKKNLPTISDINNLRFVHAFGESMEPSLSDGDILLVDSGIKSVETEGVYLFEGRNGTHVKRVTFDIFNNFIISSDNPMNKNISTIPPKDSLKTLGRIVLSWSVKKF